MEAGLVLADSPKASAALSRRALQGLLKVAAETDTDDLFPQIQEVLDSNALPTYLANDLDAVRVIGNFAAHPIKSTSTGAITEVEEGEAEWNIEVLAGLFDFYYLMPKAQEARRERLNQKLDDAGKPPIRRSASTNR